MTIPTTTMRTTSTMKSPRTTEGHAGGLDGALFRIEGVVQGVGYRWWTKATADKLGVRGSVRNLPDGSVEAIAYAESAALDRFRILLADGPPAAEVRRVMQSRPVSPVPVKQSFEITT